MAEPNTLRALSGLPLEPARLGESVLVLIDCQNTYTEGVLELDGVQAALDEAAVLLERARSAGAPVIHVQHDDGPGSLYDVNGPHRRDRRPGRPAGGRADRGEELPECVRADPSADRLASLGVQNLVLAGFMTHMCVNSTARGAFNLGYAPTVVANATADARVAGGRSRAGVGVDNSGREPGGDRRPVRGGRARRRRYPRIGPRMRMSAKAEYATARWSSWRPPTRARWSKPRIWPKRRAFRRSSLVDILSDLRTDRLVRTAPGRDGGYELRAVPTDISIADVLR